MPTEPPPITRLLAQAEEWQRLLDSGEVRSRAEIARSSGVSSMRVTQVLALLDLHPAIRAWLRALPPGTPPRKVTERTLRPIAGMAFDAQLAAVGRRWPKWKPRVLS